MKKIATPQDLQAELRRLLAYAQTERPSREKLAAEMRGLADRVAATGNRDVEKLVEKLDEFLYPPSMHSKSRGDIPGREYRVLMDWYQEASDWDKADDKMRQRLLDDMSSVSKTLDQMEKKLGPEPKKLAAERRMLADRVASQSETGWVAVKGLGDTLNDCDWHGKVHKSHSQAEAERRSRHADTVRYLHTDGYLYVDEPDENDS